ncbi:unnamed protein product [Clonostachys byssicola]|uniref:Uncharacterized protein n=1 Tax=Clonostachys byssicola TaxID=160290 RepID=A0A9N9UGE8_9HYPO|nr:unnamed protein product [Clonostachys byssicola]
MLALLGLAAKMSGKEQTPSSDTYIYKEVMSPDGLKELLKSNSKNVAYVKNIANVANVAK